MEWISVQDRLPKGLGCIVNVKKEDGTTTRAYYHADKMAWAHCYEKFPWSHWQDKQTLEWLEDVTHWMPNEMD